MALCCSENRYKTDVHYAGGCLLNDNISWASFMVTLIGCPPDPALVGAKKWKEMWMHRLANAKPWLHTWLEHQHYDDYWKQGSLCENFGAIECPVLTASGWADGYCNAVPALVEDLQPPNEHVLVRGMNGPWAHAYPHLAYPGPRSDFLSETIRWWNYCLKGDKEAEKQWRDAPAYSAFLEDYQKPNIIVEERTGRWVGIRRREVVVTQLYRFPRISGPPSTFNPPSST